MRFADFKAIYLFGLFFLLFIFLIWANLRRKKLLEKFANRELLIVLLDFIDFKKRYFKQVLLLLGTFFMIVSLMRPQFGFKWQEIKRRGLDIIVVVDVSKSMLAQDIKPNRLVRTKLALKDWLNKLEGDRVALVAFSGSAFLQCPLTFDYNGFLLSLEALNVDIIPKGGTNIYSGIKRAIESFEDKSEYRVIILITDGEDHTDSYREAIKLAKKEKVKIFCIGVGTKEGELITIKDKNDRLIFLKDINGNVVKTRLNEEVLKEISLETGGSYIRATNKEFGLEFLYKERISKLEKRELKSKMVKIYEERFQIPLGLAFLCLVLRFLVKEEKNGKVF